MDMAASGFAKRLQCQESESEMPQKLTTSQMLSNQPGAALADSPVAAQDDDITPDKPRQRRRSRLDRRVDQLLDQNPHWSSHRRIVSRVARLMLRQEVLDKELKKKGLLRKSDGAPKDALELDFKIENYIRRYLEMLPDSVQAGGQRNELIIRYLDTCPHCGEDLKPEGAISVFDEEMAGSELGTDNGGSEPDTLLEVAPGDEAASESRRQFIVEDAEDGYSDHAHEFQDDPMQPGRHK